MGDCGAPARRRSGEGVGVGWSFRQKGNYNGVGYKNKGLSGGVRGVPQSIPSPVPERRPWFLPKEKLSLYGLEPRGVGSIKKGVP